MGRQRFVDAAGFGLEFKQVAGLTAERLAECLESREARIERFESVMPIRSASSVRVIRREGRRSSSLTLVGIVNRPFQFAAHPGALDEDARDPDAVLRHYCQCRRALVARATELTFLMSSG